VDELSRTVTAGDLTLAAGDIELEMMAKVSQKVFTKGGFTDGDSGSDSTSRAKKLPWKIWYLPRSLLYR
jgi:hypothetical protein